MAERNGSEEQPRVSRRRGVTALVYARIEPMTDRGSALQCVARVASVLISLKLNSYGLRPGE